MGKVIALANHKGGVGKTTTAANLGAALAAAGRRTLLVDLDAQANLTGSLLEKPADRSLYGAVCKGEPLPVLRLNGNLDLVPSSIDMAGAEIELSSRIGREGVLADLLQPLQGEYDYILLDAPPSLGLITLNALVAAQALYIPLTAEILPASGLSALLGVVETIQGQQRLNPALRLEGIILTKWERSTLATLTEETLREKFGSLVFETKIRKNIRLAEAPNFKQPILSYAPSSNGAKDYTALAAEVIKRNTNL